MYKVSQELRLHTNASAACVGVAGGENGGDGNSPASENSFIFGKYQRTPDADAYPTEQPHVYIAPELTEPSKVQLLHLPSGAMRINSTMSFVIKRNGVRGNFEVKLENPAGTHSAVPLLALDPERFEASCTLTQAGLYKVHVKCNDVALPKSPYIIVTIAGDGSCDDDAATQSHKVTLPDFKSDASRVVCRGLGLSQINRSARNEFTVDGSAAGSNILFVGILGPQGQCDEVVIKHLGRQSYDVAYQVRHPGAYLLAVKWGDEHIPGSPFSLHAE